LQLGERLGSQIFPSVYVTPPLADVQKRPDFAIRDHLTPRKDTRVSLRTFHRPATSLMQMNRSRHLLRAQVSLFALLLWAPAIFAANSTHIVVVPVANLYSGPSDQSDVVSQAIYGSNVTLLTARGEWSRIQTADRYKGWIPSRHLRLIQSGTGYATSGVIVQVESLFANIYREPDVTRHKPVITIPFESRLQVIPDENRPDGKGTHEGWLQVRLPDKSSAWVQSGDVVADPKPLSIPESIELARRFLGIPYLWGGSSSFGFDCSGFTQMLMRSRGFNMPRDADKQAAWTGVIAVERKDLQPGDLLFFGSSSKNITHTGMYIGDGQFIHDSTNGHPVVQIGGLNDQPWAQLLVASRRVK
jgi:cell wall-associated NlpC family hydrolase